MILANMITCTIDIKISDVIMLSILCTKHKVWMRLMGMPIVLHIFSCNKSSG